MIRYPTMYLKKFYHWSDFNKDQLSRIYLEQNVYRQQSCCLGYFWKISIFGEIIGAHFHENTQLRVNHF